MKLTKQILCLLLAVLMMFAVVACGGEPENTQGNNGTQGTTPTGDGTTPTGDGTTPTDGTTSSEEGPIKKDMQNKEFILRSLVQTANAKSFDADRDGTVVNNAVFQRNDDLEARLNCKFTVEETAGDTNSNAFYDEMQTLKDGYSYDIVTTATYKMVRLAVEGMLHDLASQEYIDLEQDYYDDGYNRALNAGGRQYLTTGKYTISWYRYQICCLFNRNLVKENNLAYPYDTVLNQQWTTEEMMKYSSKLYKDLNGNGEYDVDDQFGLFMYVGSGSSQTDGWMGAFNLRLVEKTEDGYYKMMEIDKATWGQSINDLLTLIEGNGSWCTNAVGNGGVENKFISGEAGLICYRMYVVENEAMMKLGRTREGYGIVPLPKANLDQEDYSSYVQDQVLTFGIPNTVAIGDDLDDTTLFYETFAYESYKTVMPAYYERALTKRYVIDERSKAMIEIIDSNIYVDPVNVYYGTYFPLTTGSLRSCYDGSKTITSILEANYGEAFEEKCDALNSALQDLDLRLKEQGL
jgi:hypothetical protein